jgi:hypothetical protein
MRLSTPHGWADLAQPCCVASVRVRRGCRRRASRADPVQTSKRRWCPVAGGVVSPGAKIVVRVSGAVPGKRLRLYLRRWPLFTTATPIRVGGVVPSRHGSAQLTFRLPDLDSNVYAPAACCSRGDFIAGHGLLSVPALLPAGFGPLGTPGCSPALRANVAAQVLRGRRCLAPL